MHSIYDYDFHLNNSERERERERRTVYQYNTWCGILVFFYRMLSFDIKHRSIR